METPPDASVAAENRETAESEAPPARKQESWWETLRFFLFLFIAAIAIRSLLFAPFSIPSGSMLPNLMIGDYLFVAKWPFGYSRFSFPFGIAGFDGRVLAGLPERGDIVVFRYPGRADEDFVKRVIGLHGHQIEVRAHPQRRAGPAAAGRRLLRQCPTACAEGGATRRHRPRRPCGCAYPRYRVTLPGGRS